MLGKITTLSTLRPQPVDSQLEVKASTEYLINTQNIYTIKVYATDDSLIDYKLNKHEDRSPQFELTCSETNAQVQALSDVSPSSLKLLLNVHEGALTFADCADIATTAKYYNVADIVWVQENNAGTRVFMLIEEGGWGIFKIFVDYSIEQVIDLYTSGATTTTTTTSTSTTTTSTSTTSTSTTSTSSTTTTTTTTP